VAKLVTLCYTITSVGIIFLVKYIGGNAIMSFDFSQFFNQGNEEEENKSNKSPNMSLIEDLLKAATESYKGNTEITEEDAIRAFENKYGSPEEFLMNHFETMTEPYEDAMIDVIKDIVKNRGKAEYGSVITASAVNVARNFHVRMVSDNMDNGENKEVLAMKSAMLASAISKILPDNTAKDTMMAVMALLSVVSLKLAELTMQLDAQSLAEEELKGF
jgi:hypothetical protein